MADSRGKEFEKRFKRDWEKMPQALALRLPDQQSGYYGTSANPCDFIRYHYPCLFLLELKTHQGNTFPFTAFRQYSKLKQLYKPDLQGVKIGVVLWLYSHEKVVYIPIQSFIKMEQDGKKSFSVKYIDTQEYSCLELPATKLRTYQVVDYSVLVEQAQQNQI